jgi:NitT/TauT family transport system substrate-binding protein
VTIGGKAFLQYAPVTIAERLGFFKEAGLDPEILDLAGGSKALEALIAGSAELTAGAFDHTIQMQAKGQHITGFVLFGQHPTFALAIRKDKASSYQGPDSLKGMIIGVTALGSQTQFMIEYMALKVGLSPSDISFVSVGGGSGAVAAIRNGAVDAVVTGEPALTTLTSAGDVALVADTRTNAGTIGIYGGLYPSGTMYARADFIAKNPGTVQAFTIAMIRALQWMDRASVEDIADALPAEWVAPNRALFLASLRGTRDMFSPHGRFSPEGARIALDVLSKVSSSVREARIDIERTYTNDFVERAHQVLASK